MSIIRVACKIDKATSMFFGDIRTGSSTDHSSADGHLDYVKKLFRDAVEVRTGRLDEYVRVLQGKADKSSQDRQRERRLVGQKMDLVFEREILFTPDGDEAIMRSANITPASHEDWIDPHVCAVYSPMDKVLRAHLDL